MTTGLRPPRTPVERQPRRSGGGTPALTPRTAVRIATLGLIALGLIGVLVVRLWFLQVIGGTEYQQQAEANRLRTIVTEAPRGFVVDRNGTALVTNRAGEDVVARPQELTGPRGRAVLVRLARVLGVPAGRLIDKVEKARTQAPYESVVLANDVDVPLQAYLEERRRQFPGISLQSTYLRQYPYGSLGAHALGFVGAITAEDVQEFRRRGYLGNEQVGRSGVESQYEEYLRGRSGRSQVEVDASGEPVGRGVISSTPPVPGSTLQLSIDLDTQRALEQALREQVRSSGTSRGAAGIAMDPRTGEVLAIASYPTFRPDVFEGDRPRELRRITTSPGAPTLNRAIGGQYPAASTYKVFTATAALMNGFLKPDEALAAPGELELYNRVFKSFEGQDHGVVTLPVALEVSSDTFFYQLGDKFYQSPGTPLQDWAKYFGLGRPTGIDLSGEASGIVPDKAWKERTYRDSPDPLDREWKPGDSINMSVGQGNVAVTPAQLAVAYAAIANGGRIVTPTVARAVLDQGNRVQRNLVAGRPQREIRPTIKPAFLEAIRNGLFMVANGDEGTAAAIFGNLPDNARVAGKTGTAENPSGVDHSWFVGYGPYTAGPDERQIVVAVIVEKGGTGSTSAAPAACQTIAAYLRFPPARCGTPPPEEDEG